jgi:hypothetical protein
MAHMHGAVLLMLRPPPPHPIVTVIVIVVHLCLPGRTRWDVCYAELVGKDLTLYSLVEGLPAALDDLRSAELLAKSESSPGSRLHVRSLSRNARHPLP